MSATVYDCGATADAVFAVQSALVRQWMAGEKKLPKGATDEECAVYVTRCGDALILPPGHVATVLKRLGEARIGEAFLRVSLAAKKAEQKRKNPMHGVAIKKKEEELTDKLNRRKAALAKPG